MDTESSDRIPTGIEGLDTILNGGLLRGSAYVVHGPPGAGKTIFANQTCCAVARGGGRALYVSLLSETHDRMMRQMERLRFYDRSLVPKSLVYLSAFSTLRSDGLNGVSQLLFQEIRRLEADVVVIDGLLVAGEQAGDEKEFRGFVYELQGQAALANCALLMLTTRDRAPGGAEHTMVDGWIELLDDLRGVRAVRNIVVRKQRGCSFLRGRHQFRITDNGLEVFPRLEVLMNGAPSRSEATERVNSGITGFDHMIGGGYPAGSSTIIIGPTGSGKTTIGLQFLSEATPEAPGLLYGFHEAPAQLLTKARSIGIDIDGMLASGAIEIVWQSPAETLPDAIGRDLLAAVARRGAKRVLLDGLGALRNAFVFEARFPLFINALSTALRASGTTSVYTMQTRDVFMPEQLDTDDLSQMVENVILIHYVRKPKRIERELLVLKVGDCAFGAFSVGFHVSGDGVSFGESDPGDRRPAGAENASGRA